MRLPASCRRGRTSVAAACAIAALLLSGLALAQQPPAPAAEPAAAAPAKKAAAPKAASAAHSPSYSLGLSMGDQLKSNYVSADSINTAALAQGVHDALSGKAELTDADNQNINKIITTAINGAGDANHRLAAKFLAENGKKPGVVTTASGLQYKVLAPGGGEAPKPTDEVTVNYKGTLLNGTEFDSSYKRGQPAKFPLDHVIPGWSEGVGLMKPGAKYELFVPPQLAYDLRPPPRSPIPPGSMLIFEVELLSAKPAPPAPPAPPAALTPKPAPNN
jgi:FKBP-type peptidyl-prolyl cis-trans isomerase FkpA